MIAAWGVLVLAALPILPSIETPLKVGGFSSEGAEGARTTALLERELDYSPSSLVLIYSSDSIDAGSEDFQDQVAASIEKMRRLPYVEDVILPSLDESLIAPSGDVAYAIIGLNLPPEEAQRYVTEAEAAILPQPDLEIIVAGAPAFYADIETASQRDLQRAEFIALPFALIALLLVFGTVVSALVPLIVGCVGVGVILLSIYWVAHVTDVSIFALNLATMLGLGLAVDYSLFVTSRFREELHRNQGDVVDAVIVAVGRAGRAVFFSGLTVLIGLAGLAIFPLMFLRSIGIAGVIVVAVSTLAALTLLPAVLSVIGSRIERWPIGPLGRRNRHQASDTGFWSRLAAGVMKRPVVVALITIGVLLALGWPFTHANISSPDATILPQDLPSRQGFDLLAEQYSGGEISPFVIVIESIDGNMTDPANLGMIERLADQLEADDRIDRVQSALTIPGAAGNLTPAAQIAARQLLEGTGTDTQLGRFLSDDVAVIFAYPLEPANDPQNKELLAQLRSVNLPQGLELSVGGGTAEIVDVVDTIYRDFPLVATFIVVSTYLILLTLFRSVLLPIKAILMNVLSILASYGALVWIFQDGNLHELLGFTTQGFVEASLPVIMFCVLFGLSMDYEVFLLSRIQEEWERTGDNERAVAVGLQRSGQIITSAALIVVVVTASFVSADVVLIKALGLGIALAVALDATIVRALLVPATMKLLGHWNWWIPGWLERLLPSSRPLDH
ncbi:MAG: MMPL family transporter [Thermomicrobiales bacterium]